MSTKFRPSDLVPVGFIAERITHIDDESCIFLEPALLRRVRHETSDVWCTTVSLRRLGTT
ncbi:hypothetical protein [Ensifer adhaerens]|uniref:hypothetical protein n=1 Tax=Ensifer adhaerens TaxID=106592 RepID=UPI0018F80DD5|nr:hypothetical protein [Ensifer adhaerens]